MTNKILNICIMQLKRKPENARAFFASWAELQRWGIRPRMENYYKVWFEDHRNDEPAYCFDGYADLLEDIFSTFSYSKPAGFTGQSLSVGDVIAICEEDGQGGSRTRYFYTDAIGFQELTDF